MGIKTVLDISTHPRVYIASKKEYMHIVIRPTGHLNVILSLTRFSYHVNLQLLNMGRVHIQNLYTKKLADWHGLLLHNLRSQTACMSWCPNIPSYHDKRQTKIFAVSMSLFRQIFSSVATYLSFTLHIMWPKIMTLWCL